MSHQLPRLPRRVARLVATTAVLVGAMPALAQACTISPQATKQAFLQFGDLAAYQPAPGGTFESGATGWTLNGASVQSGNESYFVNMASDSHSLVVPSTSDPISAPICVDSTMPSFRLFARQIGGSWGQMNVEVLWTDAAGFSHSTTAGGINPGTNWAPTQSLALGSMLPLWQPGSTLSVRLRFVPVGGGTIALDDIEVDPYAKR